MGPGAYNISAKKEDESNLVNISPAPGFSKDVTFRINRKQCTPGGTKTDLLVEIKPYSQPLPKPEPPSRPVKYTTQGTQVEDGDVGPAGGAKGKKGKK